MGFTALVMTCKLGMRRRSMHTARTPFGLPVRHLRPDSPWSRSLDDNCRSTNDPRYSKPTGAGSSIYKSSRWSVPVRAESLGHEPAPKKVSNVTATGYYQEESIYAPKKFSSVTATGYYQEESIYAPKKVSSVTATGYYQEESIYAPKKVSKAIAGGYDQGKSVGSRSKRAPIPAGKSRHLSSSRGWGSGTHSDPYSWEGMRDIW